ncbi:efflux RND transporter periplasmic adaptor subunit [Parapedobacter koreensis]|uniref:RND family efflux transporter, MFP subunit n=1 Tax=Parapedobacter koreensis TaxID=332977 RepID=A0A1H7N0E9_9SPHI|nr:efflux RND transporter periplasmic adaptor subunit [Parapedobacter koreensis]SEL16435.1 RND family efflux transporter, MFP subunit [Parapedobacter koreensis]
MNTINFIVGNHPYTRALFFLLLAFLIGACSGRGTDDGHAHGDEHGHEHGEGQGGSITTLTKAQIQSINLTLGQLEQKELTAVIKASGRLKVPNSNKANITALYGGVIKTLRVDVGTSVRQGAIIATIVHPQFIQLQEEYLAISSKIALAEQEQERQQALNAGNVGALKNLQNAETELNVQRTRKASLFQQLRLMGIEPDKVSHDNLQTELAVTSPVGGIVSHVYAQLGSYVDASSPVAEVVQNNQLHLDLNVFEKDLPLLSIGQRIHFMLTNNPNKTYDANIFGIGASFEDESKTIPVHCAVSGDKTGLIDGMNITAAISLGEVSSTAVPNGAIVDAEGKSYIFVVTDKQPEAHEDEHNHEEESHDHAEHEHDHEHETASHAHAEDVLNFEKIEVVRGPSEMGYTAITLVNQIPKEAKIVTTGAFFINAVLTGTAGHSH